MIDKLSMHLSNNTYITFVLCRWRWMHFDRQPNVSILVCASRAINLNGLTSPWGVTSTSASRIADITLSSKRMLPKVSDILKGVWSQTYPNWTDPIENQKMGQNLCTDHLPFFTSTELKVAWLLISDPALRTLRVSERVKYNTAILPATEMALVITPPSSVSRKAHDHRELISITTDNCPWSIWFGSTSVRD